MTDMAYTVERGPRDPALLDLKLDLIRGCHLDIELEVARLPPGIDASTSDLPPDPRQSETRRYDTKQVKRVNDDIDDRRRERRQRRRRESRQEDDYFDFDFMKEIQSKNSFCGGHGERYKFF